GDERNGVKVRRQRADFLDLCGWADQEIFALVVEAAQGPHHVADVSPHAKLSHPPDVDCDLHRRHLTTESTGEHRGINSYSFEVRPALQPVPWLCVPRREEMPHTVRAPAY